MRKSGVGRTQRPPHPHYAPGYNVSKMASLDWLCTKQLFRVNRYFYFFIYLTLKFVISSSKIQKKGIYHPLTIRYWRVCMICMMSKSVISDNSMINDAEVQNSVVLLLYIVTFKQKRTQVIFMVSMCSARQENSYLSAEPIMLEREYKKREDGRRGSGNYKNYLSPF